MVKTSKIILLLFLFIALIIFAVFKNKKSLKEAVKLEERSYPVFSCKPQYKVCKVSLDKFNLEVELDKNIYYLRPFNVTIRTEEKESKEIKSIQINFKMKGMNMGVNRFNLLNINAAEKISAWKGNTLLPVCITERRDWFSEIEILTRKEKYIFSFPIDVRKN